jgi:hypothetical protein
MASWQTIADAEPAFAQAVKGVFDANVNKLLATLRRDGSPRISGIEATFGDGELWLGMMPGSRKAQDLVRDPRLALHSASPDPPEDPTTWAGDAKLSGRAEEVTDPARLRAFFTAEAESAGTDPAYFEGAHLFRVDITQVSTVRVGTPADHLLIESWHEGRGLERVKRT